MIVAFILIFFFFLGGEKVMIYRTKLVRNANGNVDQAFNSITLNNLMLVM